MTGPATLYLRDDSLPGTLAEFVQTFSDEEGCAAVLRRWKYQERCFVCPKCGHEQSWYLPSRQLDECCRCGKQVSLTAGTVMHGTRKPLRLWFLAMYLFVSSKRGISALELQRELGLAKYQTAWTWLHKLRDAVGGRGGSPLRGEIELDETWEGGLRRGKPGRPKVEHRSALVMGAVEVSAKHACTGRVRFESVADGSKEPVREFLADHVEPGSVLHTDDWASYPGPMQEHGCEHRPTNVSKATEKAHEFLPAIHRVFSLLHRVLLGTYQGGVRGKHLPRYLAEFEFRFNRRSSKRRGLLFQRLLSCATRRAPPYYWEIVGREDAQTALELAGAA
jgi:transposase-like protein